MSDRYNCCKKYFNQYPETNIPIYMDLLPDVLENINKNKQKKSDIVNKLGNFYDKSNAEIAYSGKPERLYVIENKKIIYKSGHGPEGYSIAELEKFLTKHLNLNKNGK